MIPNIDLPILLQEICGPILGIHKWDFCCSVQYAFPALLNLATKNTKYWHSRPERRQKDVKLTPKEL